MPMVTAWLERDAPGLSHAKMCGPHGAPDPIGHGKGAREVGARQHHEELLAAVAGDHVNLAHVRRGASPPPMISAVAEACAPMVVEASK